MGVIEAVVVLGGLAALYFYNQKSSGDKLIFFPNKINRFFFEGATPVVEASILVQNPTNTTFVFNSLAADALSDGTLVGNVSNFTPVQLPGNSEGDLPIKIRLLLISAANDIMDAIQSGHYDRTLTLKGTANVNGYPLPIELQFKIGI